MQVLNSSVARPWKLEQNTSGQASRAKQYDNKEGTFFWTSKAGVQKWTFPAHDTIVKVPARLNLK